MSFIDKLRQSLHSERLKNDRVRQGAEYVGDIIKHPGIPENVDTIDIMFNYDDGQVLYIRIGRPYEDGNSSSSDEK